VKIGEENALGVIHEGLFRTNKPYSAQSSLARPAKRTQSLSERERPSA